MDVSYNNVLESTRQYFQGVPPAASGSPQVVQSYQSSSQGNGSSQGPPQDGGSSYYQRQQYQTNSYLPNGPKPQYQSGQGEMRPTHSATQYPNLGPIGRNSHQVNSRSETSQLPPISQMKPSASRLNGGSRFLPSPAPPTYPYYHNQVHHSQSHQQSHEGMKQHTLQQAFYSGLAGQPGQQYQPSPVPPQIRVQEPPPPPPIASMHQPSPQPQELRRVSSTIVKRESPLDLSVKTVRQSADSTESAGPSMDHNTASGSMYYFQQQDYYRGTDGGTSSHYQHHPSPATTPKVEFMPNFSQHAQLNQRPHKGMEKMQWPQQQSLPSIASFSKANSNGSAASALPPPVRPRSGQSLPKPIYPQETARYPHNYLKRPSTEEPLKVSSPTAPKQSRVDPWRASIDQQIEKRFNSYLSSKGLNGEVKKSQYQPPYLAEQTHHKPPMVNHNNSGGAADKRVLSILRNSLETKEARNLQLQQAQQLPQTHIKVPQVPCYTELTSRPQQFAAGRHSLPAFQAASAALERGPTAAYPRLSIPKAIDSIQEYGKQQYVPNRNNYHHLERRLYPEVVDITGEEDESASRKGQQGGTVSPFVPPSKTSGEYDGLVAFLAARIRTKAELKQQVTGPSGERAATPGSSNGGTSSLSSAAFASPINDLVKTPNPELLSNSKCSPWMLSPARLTKDQALAGLPRRRLFSRSEEEAVNESGNFDSTGFPPRAPSSSEASVFDFRDSDSEGCGDGHPPDRGSRRSSIVSIPPVAVCNVPSPPRVPGLEPEVETTDEQHQSWTGKLDELVKQLESSTNKRSSGSKRGRGGSGRGVWSSPSIKTSTPLLKPKQEPFDSDSIINPTVKIERCDDLQYVDPIRITPEPRSKPVSKRGGGGGRGRGRGGKRQSKKPNFGDGSEFRQGWEEELYRFKRSLRMPPGLITISRPPGWPRAPLSLPDLEAYPDSPMTNDSLDTFPGSNSKVKDEVPSKEDKKSITQSLEKDQSFLDRLMAKFCARRKKERPKKKEKPDEKEEPSDLLPTPSLHGKDSYLGFRRETVAEFREEFLKTGAFTAEVDLPPVVLETRTRTENKAFKERLTIREVFGAERPASAPPPGTTQDDLRRRQRLRRNKQKEKRKKMFTRTGKEGDPRGSDKIRGGNKLRTFRRKLKSSGFDYIRKKKKTVTKERPFGETPKKKSKKTQPMTEQEIQVEIKGWVMNKGLGETILHRASRIGNVDVVRYCLEKLQHNPAPRDNAGYTPLHEASSRGHYGVAALLLSHGANVSDSAIGGVRPLHEAAENGFTKVVKLLLDYGADPLLATYAGAVPLKLATDEESRALMELHIANCNTPPPSIADKSDDSSTVKDEPAEQVDGFEIEESDTPLPNLYRLAGESRSDSWVLFHELAPLLRLKTKEALLKQLGQEAAQVLREMKPSDFFAKAHSRAIKSPTVGCLGSAAPKMQRLVLVKYTEAVRFLLGVETSIIPR